MVSCSGCTCLCTWTIRPYWPQVVKNVKEKREEKLCLLLEYCHKSGMVINEDKTKFMVINGSALDRQDLNVWGSVSNTVASIKYVDTYTYLGSKFTADGKMPSAVKQHVKEKRKHLLKLVT